MSESEAAELVRDEVLRALKTDEPGQALYRLCVGWRDGGCDEKTAESRMTDVLLFLLKEGREEDADAIRDVLDAIVGWCSPRSWIFNPDRGAGTDAETEPGLL